VPEPACAVVGLSTSEVCGVRDHATLLAAALQRSGLPCSWHWMMRRDMSARGARREIRAWARALARELDSERPDAIVLHYSVFDYSHRGVPLYVAPPMSALRETGVPVIAVLHELAYPWRRAGWRGVVWALTQRAALVDVMRSVSAVVVTADFQARWLQSRRWAPRRPIAMAPVFSNLPPPQAGADRGGRDTAALGIFGYSYQGVAVALVLDAMRRLAGAGIDLELRLLGAPGRSSPAGERWLAEAGRRGLADALWFSGALPAQELSDALAACSVLICPDRAGPSSRKGSLAASLAAGRPVVAIDGPRTWSRMSTQAALRLVAAEDGALAGAISELLHDTRAADELGARGRAFHEHEMSVEVTVAAVRGLLERAGVAPAPGREATRTDQERADSQRARAAR
jgi:glycosyltransferase involved in cell wall biosynthesis